MRARQLSETLSRRPPTFALHDWPNCIGRRQLSARRPATCCAIGAKTSCPSEAEARESKQTSDKSRDASFARPARAAQHTCCGAASTAQQVLARGANLRQSQRPQPASEGRARALQESRAGERGRASEQRGGPVEFLCLRPSGGRPASLWARDRAKEKEKKWRE